MLIRSRPIEEVLVIADSFANNYLLTRTRDARNGTNYATWDIEDFLGAIFPDSDEDYRNGVIEIQKD